MQQTLTMACCLFRRAVRVRWAKSMPYRVARCTPEQTRKSKESSIRTYVRPVATGSTARIEMAQSGIRCGKTRLPPQGSQGSTRQPITADRRPNRATTELLLRLFFASSFFSGCPESSGSSTGAASRSCHCNAPWPSPHPQRRRSRKSEAAGPHSHSHSQGSHAKCAGAARCDRAASPIPASVHSRTRSAGVGIRLRASSPQLPTTRYEYHPLAPSCDVLMPMPC